MGSNPIRNTNFNYIMLIKHAVWPTGIPYCQRNWSQDDWNRYAESFRPKGYEWDMFDEIAWNAHAAIHDEEERVIGYEAFGVVGVCKPLQKNLDAIALLVERESSKPTIADIESRLEFLKK